MARPHRLRPLDSLTVRLHLAHLLDSMDQLHLAHLLGSMDQLHRHLDSMDRPRPRHLDILMDRPRLHQAHLLDILTHLTDLLAHHLLAILDRVHLHLDSRHLDRAILETWSA